MISSQSRYDRFDTLPYSIIKISNHFKMISSRFLYDRFCALPKRTNFSCAPIRREKNSILVLLYNIFFKLANGFRLKDALNSVVI
jgi:hypothetical protein